MIFQQKKDIAVIGGGMVGAAVALGLAQNDFQIVLVEKTEPPIFNLKYQPDIRVSAINTASVSLLKSLGVWDTIRLMRVHPYRRLETWEWERAHVLFDSHEIGLSELGFIVENNVLQRALWNALITHPSVTILCPAYLKKAHRLFDHWLLYFSDEQILEAQMVIGADGPNSQIRLWAGINTHTWKYRKSCILITVKCKKESGYTAWQHFSPTGPLAFLPLYDNWATLVWYDSLFYIHYLQSMKMTQLQKAITDTFPSRLGEVTPVQSSSFLLIRKHALRYVQNGLALVGDAAHTIHPLSGLGVNLGYRDVDTLLSVIINARNSGEDWSNTKVLERYQRRRQTDNFLMQIGVDIFYAGFNSSLPFVRTVRNLGLMAVQHIGILKRFFLNFTLRE